MGDDGQSSSDAVVLEINCTEKNAYIDNEDTTKIHVDHIVVEKSVVGLDRSTDEVSIMRYDSLVVITPLVPKEEDLHKTPDVEVEMNESS